MKWAAREILVEEDRSLLQIKPVGFFRFEWFNPTGTSGSNLCNFEKPSSRRRALNRNNWSKTSREGKCSTRTMEFETAENDGHLRERSSRKKRKRKESKTWMTTEEKKPTVNIAVAGSIIDNAQSLELATLLAGQVARAATIFRIDEVVVFDNRASSDVDTVVRTGHDGDESESGAEFLTMILRYLETPQYLRRRLFPTHKSLKFVGLLPPLDAPHHLRKHEWCSFREGVTLDVNPPSSKGTLVDVGLNKNVVIEEVLEPGK
ncbi:hypothetical protein MUK42_03493 [Musa troglodytarum]|uniref:Uncharacterized protein n=1 Tax=Musa troglodytarum TaxID=320322 RepID=A0A9E7KET0_9LILI|nr:hypothetical protein MUK42_03493 [Musa troglodytarum]